jgi:hypothetical protein
MNKVFDYNGTFVSTSTPKKQLRTVKKTFLIDSADRDTTKYFTNGDFVVYLPRNYKNVVSIRLKSATFPPLTVGAAGGGALSHTYAAGPNILPYPSGTPQYAADVPVPATNFYFLLELEGYNKNDETTVAAQRSTFVDNFFARIPVSLSQQNTLATPTYYIEYNDNTHEENTTRYTPAIENLDRLRVKCRLHSQQGNVGFIYWTNDGAYPEALSDIVNFSLVLEVEMLDNGFDDFSSLESRINNRDAGNYGC